ncbi:MAG: hypothetical protein KY463_04305 [Actinobacteria bacterium]|nr:hypothetical protein [Actinomycetota bacterium]
MPPINVEVALLRLALPGVALSPGAVLAARVLERSGARGMLSLAGGRLPAELPDNLQPGDSVRLRVEEVGTERILLRVVEAEPQAAPVAAPVALPLPGGAKAGVAVRVEPDGAAGERSSWTVAVAYGSPVLGPIDLRLTLDATALRAEVDVAPGSAIEAAQEQAQRLQDALAEAAGRPASVRIRPRRDPVDVYA